MFLHPPVTKHLNADHPPKSPVRSSLQPPHLKTLKVYQQIRGAPNMAYLGESRRQTFSSLNTNCCHWILRQEECPAGYSTKTLGSFILEDLTLTVVTMQSHVAASRTAARNREATVYVDIISTIIKLMEIIFKCGEIIAALPQIMYAVFTIT